MRSRVTLGACICDNVRVQRVLPQLVVIARSLMSAATFRDVQAIAPATFNVVRGTSSWVTSEILCNFLGVIEEAIRPFPLVPVLLLDTHGSHTTPEVMARARELGILLLYVPAGMTFLAQPLDTHVFAAFKRALRVRAQAARTRNPAGTLGVRDWAAALFEAAQSTITGRRWARAFSAVGCRDATARLTSQLRARLGVATAADVAGDVAMPTLEDITSLWPQGRQVPYEELLGHAMVFD